MDVEVEVRREEDIEFERLGVSEKPESLRGAFMACSWGGCEDSFFCERELCLERV